MAVMVAGCTSPNMVHVQYTSSDGTQVVYDREGEQNVQEVAFASGTNGVSFALGKQHSPQDTVALEGMKALRDALEILKPIPIP